MSPVRHGSILALAVFVALGLLLVTGATQPDTASAATIGPGSCLDMSNCENLAPGTVIGANSCNGLNACDGLNGTVGNNSCNGNMACNHAGEGGGSFTVGNGSCLSAGSPGACEDAAGGGGSAIIGDDSCTYEQSCYSAGVGGSAVIGNHSCQFIDACWRFGEGGSAVVGEYSCSAEDACQYVGNTGGDGIVADGACNAFQACYRNGETGFGSVGDNSCNAPQACYYNGHEGVASIGSGSCNAVFQVCYQNGYQGTASIGNLSCNGSQDCYQNQQDIGDCERNDPVLACVIITKEVASGPTNVTFRFDGSFEPFMLADGESYYVLSAAGYREVEELSTSGWALDGIRCTGASTSINGATVQFNLSVGTLTECTFVNRYVPRAEERPRPPNIGAGLSGLFATAPTPVPTAPPAAVAPSTSPVIRPPSTGDAGLAHGEGARWAGMAVTPTLFGLSVFGMALLRQRFLRSS